MSNDTVRRTRMLILAGLFGGLVLSAFAGGVALAGDAPGDVPASLIQALPDGARIEQAIPDHYTGDERTQWAVLYTIPAGASRFARHGVAAMLEPDGRTWTVLYQRLEECPDGGLLKRYRIDETPAAAFFNFAGAHSQGVTVVRWDGDTFVEVLRAGSNTPAIGMSDLDEDGTPEVVMPWSPYCGSYAASPLLVTVYAWTGSTFAEATGRYPAVLDDFRERLHDALAAGREDTVEGLACLHTARAWLAQQAGDGADVAQACADARLAAPDYRAAWAGDLCR